MTEYLREVGGEDLFKAADLVGSAFCFKLVVKLGTLYIKICIVILLLYYYRYLHN